MKRNSLMTLTRLAVLAAFSLVPAMACTYAASTDNAVVQGQGGTTQVSIVTQPGCIWHLDSLSSWMSVNTNAGSGAGGTTVNVAANPGSERTGIIQGHGSFGQCPITDDAVGAGCGQTALIVFRVSVTQAQAP